MSFYVGEALSGDGNEIAHIDLLIGDKSGPVGVAFANALSKPKPRPQQSVGGFDPQPGCETSDRHDHEGDDQGCQASRPDVRPRPVRRRQGRCGLSRRWRDP